MKTLFLWLSRWPLPLLHALGWVLGWLAFLGSPRYRRQLLANAAQAGFGRPVAWASVAHAGKMAAELPRLWLGAGVPVEWDDQGCVQEAINRGRGLLILTPHLGCFEITAQAFAERFGDQKPLTVLFRPSRQPALRELVAEARLRPGLNTAPTTLSGVRQLIKALKAGQAVGLLPDQVPPLGQGLWAPFFGRPAYTMGLPAKLLRASGAQVLVTWGERLPGGRGFVVHMRPLKAFGLAELDADPQRAAEQINQVVETVVRQLPAQHLWGYDRYKAPRAPVEAPPPQDPPAAPAPTEFA